MSNRPNQNLRVFRSADDSSKPPGNPGELAIYAKLVGGLPVLYAVSPNGSEIAVGTGASGTLYGMKARLPVTKNGLPGATRCKMSKAGDAGACTYDYVSPGMESDSNGWITILSDGLYDLDACAYLDGAGTEFGLNWIKYAPAIPAETLEGQWISLMNPVGTSKFASQPFHNVTLGVTLLAGDKIAIEVQSDVGFDLLVNPAPGTQGDPTRPEQYYSYPYWSVLRRGPIPA
jgi:hypothetical protein